MTSPLWRLLSTMLKQPSVCDLMLKNIRQAGRSAIIRWMEEKHQFSIQAAQQRIESLPPCHRKTFALSLYFMVILGLPLPEISIMDTHKRALTELPTTKARKIALFANGAGYLANILKHTTNLCCLHCYSWCLRVPIGENGYEEDAVSAKYKSCSGWVLFFSKKAVAAKAAEGSKQAKSST